MITLNIEIRYANSMQGCLEYTATTKEEALLDYVQDAMTTLYQKYPKLAGEPYAITPSKAWQKLSEKVYWFKDQEGQRFPSLCVIRKKKVGLPESEMVPVYLTFRLAKDVPKITSEIYEDDAFLDS